MEGNAVKTYVSEILKHNGKTYRLPLPPKYRELADCVKALDIKDESDEDDLRVIGYETIMGLPIPDIVRYPLTVERIAKEISSLTAEQVVAISAVCSSFGVDYVYIAEIIEYIKEKSRGELEWK